MQRSDITSETCGPKEFRQWHESRILELYDGAVQAELRQSREDWMFRAKWLCCRDVE